MKALYLALVVSSIQLGTSSPVPSSELLVDEDQLFNYLSSYGYIQTKDSTNNKEVLESGLKRFQKYFKLPETGVVDENVFELIQKPRCGIADVSNEDDQSYTIGGTGFNKKAISYFIQNYHQNLDNDYVDDSVEIALQKWGHHAGLTFSVKTLLTDILLRFQPRYHLDPYPFDGPLGVLAHAFFPNVFLYGGDVHFDNAENWNDVDPQNPVGIDFYSVVLHELGHSLGLGHSEEPLAVMYPYYQIFDKANDLHADDIAGIKAIYDN